MQAVIAVIKLPTWNARAECVQMKLSACKRSWVRVSEAEWVYVKPSARKWRWVPAREAECV